MNEEQYSYDIKAEVFYEDFKAKIDINDILKMPSESLFDKIMEYSEEYDIDVTYIAELFEKNKEYKELLYTSCVENGIIKDDEFKKILESRLG
jgi:hypothetical protein